MGAENSKNEPTLAEKRYKVDKPRAKKKVPVQPDVEKSPDEKKDDVILNLENRITSSTSGIPRISSPMSETSDDPSTNESTSSYKKHFLCKRERMLLEHSWRKTRKTGSEHVGSKIFLMVLTAQPDIKAIFGMEKIPQGRLKYDPRFRQHATVFTKTFDYVIKNIDYPEKLETHFESLGRRHVVMQGRGFDPLYWETFAECMTQAAVEWEANRQRPTLGAWRTLVCFKKFLTYFFPI
ncbi:globin [Necator americanus]|uniref:Globin n=1 Tax=Necator americanus TaxID=51031 RepID=W2TDJ5_NECAM|nr:globin [Necator americanus]ETN79246.1 globin [Necator americanus]